MQANSNGNGLRAKRRYAGFRRWRAVHLVTGFVVALWLLLMALTGVLLNHQEEFGLLEAEIDNGYLPAHYTDEFHPETNRLNVVVADLHSGRFFGSGGRYIGDVVSLLIVISIFSGIYSYFLRRRLSARPAVETAPVIPWPAKPPASEVLEAEPRLAAPLRQSRE